MNKDCCSKCKHSIGDYPKKEVCKYNEEHSVHDGVCMFFEEEEKEVQ